MSTIIDLANAIKRGKDLEYRDSYGEWHYFDPYVEGSEKAICDLRVKPEKPEYRIVFTNGSGFATCIRGDIPNASSNQYIAAKERLVFDAKARWITNWLPLPKEAIKGLVKESEENMYLIAPQ